MCLLCSTKKTTNNKTEWFYLQCDLLKLKLNLQAKVESLMSKLDLILQKLNLFSISFILDVLDSHLDSRFGFLLNH